MKETLKYNKEIEFENTISEIASISLECTYNEDNRNANGVFLIEGSYKSFELFDEESFRYELPFEKQIDNLKESTLSIEINDFTYEINANKLLIDIDYTISYEKDEDYLDEEELNRFLEDHEVDVISFKEEKTEEPENEEEVRLIEEVPVAESSDNYEDERNKEMTLEETNINIEAVDDNEDKDRLIEDTILSNISKEEKYITYHVYIVENDDTLESISKKYNVSINEIIEYNNIEELKGGMKLILPAKDE